MSQLFSCKKARKSWGEFTPIPLLIQLIWYLIFRIILSKFKIWLLLFQKVGETHSNFCFAGVIEIAHKCQSFNSREEFIVIEKLLMGGFQRDNMKLRGEEKDKERKNETYGEKDGRSAAIWHGHYSMSFIRIYFHVMRPTHHQPIFMCLYFCTRLRNFSHRNFHRFWKI